MYVDNDKVVFYPSQVHPHTNLPSPPPSPGHVPLPLTVIAHQALRLAFVRWLIPVDELSAILRGRIFHPCMYVRVCACEGMWMCICEGVQM